MRKPTLRTPGLFLMLALTPLACSDGGGGPADEGAVGSACTADTDCNTGWCLKEKSFLQGYCSKDCAADKTTCPGGSTCQAYGGFDFCLDDCAGDDDCRDGYICDYNVCVPPCQSDKMCQQGDLCLAGRCKAKCTADAECGDALRCQDGKCVPPCKSDDDCLPGFSCETGSGSCKAKPGKPMGQACASDAECATGTCLPDRRICSIPCSTSDRCPSAYSCGLETYDKDNNGSKDSAMAACVPAKGQNIAGETCSTDDKCASGHCYLGFCMEGCEADADCGNQALQCVPVNVLLPGAIAPYKGCLPRQGSSTYTVGTFDTMGQPNGIDIPPNASSFILSTEVKSISEVGAVARLVDPNGNVLVGVANDLCGSFSEPIRYRYDVQYSSLFVPNTTDVTLTPGIHTYYLTASQANLPVTVKIKLKLGTAQKGTLNINWFFVDLSGTDIPAPVLNAASAPTHSWLGKIRNNLGSILNTAGLTIGTETFHDVKDASLDVIDMPPTGTSGVELQKLFAQSQGQSGNAVNVFFVRNIKTATMGGVVLGIAGGIPGPAGVHGTVHSGLAMSMLTASFEKFGYNPAHTLAHEIGHYLGLSHNLENQGVPGFTDGKVVCPCPCGKYMTCMTQSGGTSWCRGMDPLPDTDDSQDNLMYFAAESTEMFKGNKLSPGQIRVILNNPVVGH